MNLLINGHDTIVSGSAMIPPGTTGAIKIPGGTIRLTFQTSGQPGFHWDHWNLTITSPENPLGIGFDVPLTAGDGQLPMKLSMTVHTVGEGASAYRIVHYTGYNAS